MYVPKGESWSHALLAETAKTVEKNRDVSQRHALFCEGSFGKIDAKDVELFRNGSVHESVDYFGTIEYFSENFDGEISLYANESYDERAVYFRR